MIKFRKANLKDMSILAEIRKKQLIAEGAKADINMDGDERF